MAATLGIGALFSASGSANTKEVAYWQDGCAFADSAVQAAGVNIVTQTRWGYGLRIFFRVRKLDDKFNLTYKTLDAGIQYGSLIASYEVQTLGLGPQALPAILDGLSQFGELTADTIRDLNGKVLANVNALQPPTRRSPSKPLQPSSYAPLAHYPSCVICSSLKTLSSTSTSRCEEIVPYDSPVGQLHRRDGPGV